MSEPKNEKESPCQTWRTGDTRKGKYTLFFHKWGIRYYEMICKCVLDWLISASIKQKRSTKVQNIGRSLFQNIGNALDHCLQRKYIPNNFWCCPNWSSITLWIWALLVSQNINSEFNLGTEQTISSLWIISKRRFIEL